MVDCWKQRVRLATSPSWVPSMVQNMVFLYHPLSTLSTPDVPPTHLIGRSATFSPEGVSWFEYQSTNSTFNDEQLVLVRTFPPRLTCRSDLIFFSCCITKSAIYPLAIHQGRFAFLLPTENRLIGLPSSSFVASVSLFGFLILHPLVLHH